MEADLKELHFNPSTIETVDTAFYEWVNETMNVWAQTSEGWKKVPVVWLSAERAFQMKEDKDIRDSSGMVKLPIITIERTSINKDPTKTGAFPANIRPINDEQGGYLTIARRINQEKSNNFTRTTVASKRFSLRDPRAIQKTVYQTISVPIPIHLNITYTLNVKCEFLQQLNQVITPFFSKNGNTKYFVFISKDKHKFEAFIKGDFGTTSNSNNLAEERKLYTSKIEIEVLGRIFGSDLNQEKPKVVIRENAVEVKIGREKTILRED